MSVMPFETDWTDGTDTGTSSTADKIATGQERGKKRSGRATIEVAFDSAWTACSTTGLDGCNTLVVDTERKPLQGRFRTRAVEMGSTGVRCQICRVSERAHEREAEYTNQSSHAVCQGSS